MTEEELKTRKLEIEISEMSKPFWKRPQYVTTTIISVLTILITAAIGFNRYFENVDNSRKATIEKLEETIERDKEQKHELEIARQNFELSTLRNENREALNIQKEVEKEVKEAELKLKQAESKYAQVSRKYAAFVDNVQGTLSEYKELAPKHGNRLINSRFGQKAILEILEIPNADEQRIAIGKFAYGITNQTYVEINKEISKNLGIK